MSGDLELRVDGHVSDGVGLYVCLDRDTQDKLMAWLADSSAANKAEVRFSLCGRMYDLTFEQLYAVLAPFEVQK